MDYQPACYRCRVEAGKDIAGVKESSLCIPHLRARNAELEAEVARLNKMRVHCENCGADYMATGIEAGCPCKLTAEVARMRKALEAISGWNNRAQAIIAKAVLEV